MAVAPPPDDPQVARVLQLSGANLMGADLTGAVISPATFAGCAKSLTGYEGMSSGCE